MAGENPEPRHILSFGGGVNSMALAILLLRQGRPLDEAIFADTGGEVPETYEYLKVAERYLADHGVSLRQVRRDGPDLYETCVKRRVIPSAIWRWSTRDFKVRPIRRYYRDLGQPIVQYIAIAYDEIERMKDSDVDYIVNQYPLVDDKITRDGCIEIIRSAGLPIPPKSGCWFCPFNNLGRWQWLRTEHPDLFAKAVSLEEESKHFPSQRLTDQVYRKRANVLLRELPIVVTDDTDAVPCGGECFV